MANFKLDVDTALFTALNTQTVLDAVKGGVHNTIAPEEAEFPYIVFQMLSKEEERHFALRGGNALYVVKCVSDKRWPKEAMDGDTQIDTALEDATLTIANHNQLLCRRERDVSFFEARDGEVYNHAGGMYRVIADES
tara:strand:+ start:67 stop:477 length:411 start_codon:yes stop_codon:yes gene_type:complete